MATGHTSETPFQPADPEQVQLIEALKAEVLNLHKQNVALQVQHISSEARIAALEKALKDALEALEKPSAHIVIQPRIPPKE